MQVTRARQSQRIAPQGFKISSRHEPSVVRFSGMASPRTNKDWVLMAISESA